MTRDRSHQLGRDSACGLRLIGAEPWIHAGQARQQLDGCDMGERHLAGEHGLSLVARLQALDHRQSRVDLRLERQRAGSAAQSVQQSSDLSLNEGGRHGAERHLGAGKPALPIRVGQAEHGPAVFVLTNPHLRRRCPACELALGRPYPALLGPSGRGGSSR
ncbi:MAG TPA: hypothetical protein VGU45_14320 [Microvirga sp.]|nr:hypothetical protein [Microvirga sp.]